MLVGCRVQQPDHRRRFLADIRIERVRHRARREGGQAVDGVIGCRRLIHRPVRITQKALYRVQGLPRWFI